MSEYRIREGVVEHCNGYRCWKQRMFIAERKVSFLGLWSFWWPCTNASWRTDGWQAEGDAVADARLRRPLTKPYLVRIEDRPDA